MAMHHGGEHLQQQPDLLRAVAAYASVGALPAHSPDHTPRLSSRASPIKAALASSLLHSADDDVDEEFPPRTSSRRRVRSRTSSSALSEACYAAHAGAAAQRAVRAISGWPQVHELQLDGMGLMTWEEIEVGCERMLRAFRELAFDEVSAAAFVLSLPPGLCTTSTALLLSYLLLAPQFKATATSLYTELPREALWAIWGSSHLCDAILSAERALYEVRSSPVHPLFHIRSLPLSQHLLRFLDEHISDPPIEVVCSALRDLAVSFPTEVQASLQGSGSRGRFPDAFVVSRTELAWRWCECLC